MAKAKNKVIAGDYMNGSIKSFLGSIQITVPLHFGVIEVSRKTVSSIEVIDGEHSRATSSVIARGLIGGAIAGPAGALIGGATTKVRGVYQVAIAFKDGKRSLVEVDEDLYKRLIKVAF